MDSPNLSINEVPRPSEPMSQPHFDEEATLLSARRVVPLEMVKAKAGSRVSLLLALSVMVSVLFGAVGAILVVYLERGSEVLKTSAESLPAQSGEQSLKASEQASPISSPSVADGSSFQPGHLTASANIPSAGNNEGPGAAMPGVERGRLARKRISARGRDKSLSSASSKAVQSYARDKLGNERHARRNLRVARGRAGEAEREGRKFRVSSDDLLRIGEIFEGSPRR